MNATTSQSNTQSPSEHLKEIETMDTQQYLQATAILDYNSKEIYDCNRVQVRKGAVSGLYIKYS